MLTADRLRFLLRYEPNTGFWYRRTSRGGRWVGDRAGFIGDGGYRRLRVDGVIYKSSRLAWLWMTGEWPSDDLDHEDTFRWNDVWVNLRLANQSQNNANQNVSVRNKSGFKGVSWHKAAGKWQASICFNGHSKHLGMFDDKERAAAAYGIEAVKLQGEFARV